MQAYCFSTFFIVRRQSRKLLGGVSGVTMKLMHTEYATGHVSVQLCLH